MVVGWESAQEEAALTSEPKAGGGERGGKEVREREHEGETLRPVVFREGFLSWGVFRQDLQEG